MDIIGVYVELGGVGSAAEGAPKQTIGIIGVTQNRSAPANNIQLQVDLVD